MIRNQEFLAISVRDVSEREVSRLRLKQHEALLREIPEPLHILDAVGRVIYWNVGAQRLYGYTALEAIGQSAHDLLKIVPPAGDSDNVHAREYMDVDRWTGQLQAVTKDGRLLRIERRRTRISEGDATVGEVIFDLDLGQRSRLNRGERRSQRLEALGTLASGITHDLNNLLTPILMSSRMLQRGGEHLDREAMLETIVSAASRGAELISQLLTFARGGEGQHAPVSISDLFKEVAGILKHTLKKTISLEVTIEPELPEICADATELSQVIMNLAINARDAMPDGGTLAISAKSMTLQAERTYSLVTLQPGTYVAISVTDTGVGIPQSIRDRIFDPFFSTKERGQGTGLGLSTSLGIIRSHEGAIDVDSSVGKGTTVTVVLPTIDSNKQRISTS
jgi:PAS domain S-box-containing protein